MPSPEEWMANPVVAFTAQWLETWHQTMLPNPDPRRLRTRWLTDLSRGMDLYMRSPVFLGLMQQSLGAMTRASRLFFPVRPR